MVSKLTNKMAVMTKPLSGEISFEPKGRFSQYLSKKAIDSNSKAPSNTKAIPATKDKTTRLSPLIVW